MTKYLCLRGSGQIKIVIQGTSHIPQSSMAFKVCMMMSKVLITTAIKLLASACMHAIMCMISYVCMHMRLYLANI